MMEGLLANTEVDSLGTTRDVSPRTSHLERRSSASHGDELPEGSRVEALTAREQRSHELK